MSRTVYVVTGMTGEYSDRREWPAAVFADEREAQAFVQLATAHASLVAQQLADFRESDDPRAYCDEGHILESPYDPAFQMLYNGTRYHYEAVPLRERATEAAQ